VSCAAGKYNPRIGSASALACLPCAAGAYGAAGSLTSCALCAAGGYSPSVGATDCANAACPAGSYCPAGSGAPTPCPLNTFSTAYSAASASACARCPANFFTLSAGSTSCTSAGGGGASCSSGTFFNASAPSSCTPCPAGTASSGANATSLGACAPCPAGAYSGAGAASCQQCPAGSFCVGGQPFLCDAGTYGATAGAGSPEGCTPCPPGRSSPLPGAASISACVPCAAGSFAVAPGASACSLCPPGTGSVLVGAASDVCAPCAAGTFNPLEGQAWCAYDCPAGYRGVAEGGTSQAAACEPCGVGYFSPFSGSLRCSACPTGTFADAANASFCGECPAGFYGASPAATSAAQCRPCAAGTFNSVPGQPIFSCLACAAGRASGASGATSDGACAACAPGTFAPPGAAACAPAPAGKYAEGEGAAGATDCPLGRFASGAGGASADACAPCAAGTTTASTGAIAASQCLPRAFVCPLGTQPAPGSAAPTGAEGCAPLACPPPLRPGAWAAFPSDAAALLASSFCVGCGPGSAGSPGSCTACAPGEFCPGLLSRPLLNFSAAAAAASPPPGPPPGARALLAARPQPWGACPKLSTPALPAAAGGGGATAAAAAALSRAQQAATAGGVFLGLLLLAGLATARAPPPSQPRTWAARAAWLARALDMYSLSHLTDVEKSPVNRPTASGGVFTLLGLTGIATYAAYMVLQWQDSNTLVQRSLDAVDGGVWGAAGALPWAAAPLPGAPAGATGLLLRLTLDGEPGMCASPLAPPAASGLLRGGWAQVGAVADCGGSGASQLTYACADCDVGPAAALTFTFHYSCQSLLLEAAAVPAYPAGATSAAAAAAAATAAAPAGGGLLTSLAWEAPPLLTLCRDRVAADAAASKRGYAFTLSSVAPTRPALAVDGAGNLVVRPLAAALNLTISLPLAPTFVTTSLTPLVPWTQLLANIVGLSGVLSVVGVLFGVAEKRLARGGKAPLGGAGASEGGDARAQLARLGALVRLANERFAEAAEAAAGAAALERSLLRALGGGGGGGGGGDAHAVENPLLRAGRAAPVAPPTAAAPVVWQRHCDGADVWFTSSAGDTSWELPRGAALAGEPPPAPPPAQHERRRRSRSARRQSGGQLAPAGAPAEGPPQLRVHSGEA
jgi:hypothetical protein